MQLKRTLLWLTCAAMLLPAALSWAAEKDCGDGIFSTICSKFKSLETLEISAPDRFLYAVINGGGSEQKFDRLTCKVRSLYGGQALSGELRALATFHRRTDYQPDLSTDPPTASSREVAFTVAASDPITEVTLSANESTEYTFYFPGPGIEAGITDLRFAVFFKGFSGAGGNTPVTAYGTKDLNEPQHILLVNSTDRLYIDGALYTAEEVRADPSLSWRIPDQRLDPYLDSVLSGEFYLTDRIEAPHMQSSPLAPGEYARVIIIADAPAFNLYGQHTSESRGGLVLEGSQPIGGVVNQGDGDDFKFASVKTFRGKTAHEIFWVCWHHPDSDGFYDVVWPTLLADEPSPVTVAP